MSELKESLATIRQASSELIAAIDEKRKGMTMEETEEKPTEKKESVTAKLKAAQNSEKRMPTKPRNKQKEDGLITI